MVSKGVSMNVLTPGGAVAFFTCPLEKPFRDKSGKGSGGAYWILKLY